MKVESLRFGCNLQLHVLTQVRLPNPYVIVISLDFSKAFDTVRHLTLLNKLAQLDLPDHVYNWLTNFFTGHSHCTSFCGQTSEFESINASIIQESSLGPAAYTVNAGDLKTTTSGNILCKFADDTYLIVPARNEASRPVEFRNIQFWAKDNNLTLNCAKSSEVVFSDPKRRRQHNDSPLIPGIVRRQKLRMLGIAVASDFTVSVHVQDLTAMSAQTTVNVLNEYNDNYDLSVREDQKSLRLTQCVPAEWHQICRLSKVQECDRRKKTKHVTEKCMKIGGRLKYFFKNLQNKYKNTHITKLLTVASVPIPVGRSLRPKKIGGKF